jgi:hypothetical protein
MLVSVRGIWSGAWLLAVAVMSCATVASAQKPPAKPDQKAADAAAIAQQQEIQGLVRVADAAMSGQAAPSDFPIHFQNDFLKAQASRVWVPITLTIDAAKLSGGPMALYLRVTPRGATAPAGLAAEDPKDRKDAKKNDKTAAPPGPAYPYEDVSFLSPKPAAPGQPVRIQRGIGVLPGSYDLYIVLRERPAAGVPPAAGAAPSAAAPRTSVLKQPLDVPNYASGEFSTSTVILAERVDTLPAAVRPDQQSERPYAFGQTEIVPAGDRRFRKSQELIVLLQIYNPTVSPEKKFDIEATYTFFRQDGGEEKRFNSTEPQRFSAESMGASFDPSGNSSIQAGQGVPLESFPEGNYRLEIKITDKLSNKALTQNVNFTVTS